MDCTGTSGGLSLSFRDESMRMERLLGSICQLICIGCCKKKAKSVSKKCALRKESNRMNEELLKVNANFGFNATDLSS